MHCLIHRRSVLNWGQAGQQRPGRRCMAGVWAGSLSLQRSHRRSTPPPRNTAHLHATVLHKAVQLAAVGTAAQDDLPNLAVAAGEPSWSVSQSDLHQARCAHARLEQRALDRQLTAPARFPRPAAWCCAGSSLQAGGEVSWLEGNAANCCHAHTAKTAVLASR